MGRRIQLAKQKIEATFNALRRDIEVTARIEEKISAVKEGARIPLLNESLDALEGKQRLAFELQINGKTHREIGALMKIPAGTAGSLVNHAKKKIKTWYKEKHNIELDIKGAGWWKTKNQKAKPKFEYEHAIPFFNYGEREAYQTRAFLQVIRLFRRTKLKLPEVMHPQHLLSTINQLEDRKRRAVVGFIKDGTLKGVVKETGLSEGQSHSVLKKAAKDLHGLLNRNETVSPHMYDEMLPGSNEYTSFVIEQYRNRKRKLPVSERVRDEQFKLIDHILDHEVPEDFKTFSELYFRDGKSLRQVYIELEMSPWRATQIYFKRIRPIFEKAFEKKQIKLNKPPSFLKIGEDYEMFDLDNEQIEVLLLILRNNETVTTQINSWAWKVFWGVFKNFSKEVQEIFDLRAKEGLTFTQISKKLNISAANAKARYSYAIEEARAVFSDPRRHDPFVRGAFSLIESTNSKIAIKPAPELSVDQIYKVLENLSPEEQMMILQVSLGKNVDQIAEEFGVTHVRILAIRKTLIETLRDNFL